MVRIKKLELSPHAKTYANQQNLDKAVEAACKKYEGWYTAGNMDEVYEVITVTNEQGRLHPIILCSPNHTQIGIYLAHDGFQTICT